ncbi:Uncharacterised protein [Chromobacterium violaceum]|uniref:Uncharacterized protein n=1 Tax=Chromobacterium violaceum TaxID=536 RepID=A0A447TIT8_CHRVL|nr:Uncharacterised protein [Chromobacterium violaceum]
MNERELRALSRDIVRELGMLAGRCGEVDLSPVEAHLLIELEAARRTISSWPSACGWTNPTAAGRCSGCRARSDRLAADPADGAASWPS